MKQSNHVPLPLEQRIRRWMDNNPARAHAGERMLEQLRTIRAEFDQETAERLEALVEETLERQVAIDQSRREGLKAAEDLRDSMQAMAKTMEHCVVTARQAHRTAVGALMSAIATKAKRERAAKPAQPNAATSSKKLMN